MQTASSMSPSRQVALYPSNCKDIVSRHTGRAMVENTSEEQFLIPESWSIKGCVAAIEQWSQLYNAELASKKIKPVLQYANQLRESDDASAFATTLDDALAFAKLSVVEKPSLQRNSMTDLLSLLWKEGCLLWPRWPVNTCGVAISATLKSWACLDAGPAELWEQVRSTHESLGRSATTALSRLTFYRSYSANILDIQPPPFALFKKIEDHRAFSYVGKQIMDRQRRLSPDATHYTQAEFARNPKSTIHTREDPTFQWAVEKTERCARWRAETAAYFRNVKRSRATVIRCLNYWLDLVVARKIPDNPQEIFKMGGHELTQALSCSTAHTNRYRPTLAKFLNFSLVRLCGAEDDTGRVHILQGFQNPLAGEQRKVSCNAAQTHREPMPTRFVHMCIETLTADDFAWAKAYGIKHDHIEWSNPRTGATETIWCPTRAYALLAKLLLPTRTIQIRMLDSGEADTERYDPASAVWTQNQGPLSKQGGVRNGVFRSYHRKDGSRGSLIYLNTNKTADADAASDQRGYVMPWEHKQALELFGRLRDWQERYNAIRRPTPWRDVPEYALRSEDVLQTIGSACFLFRDPTVRTRKDLPVTDKRLQKMWAALLEEVERRLARAGETLPDGSAIRLVRLGAAQRHVALYDLHTLRVTLITAFYQQGVPPEYIMKLAGHASVVMTLYYVKLSPQDISNELDKALLEKQQKDQTEWLAFLQKQSRDELTKVTAHTHSSGVEALGANSFSGLLVMDHGFCPLGARRCGDGLVLISESGHQSFGSVPGGPGNCVRCRFFMTGPAFLIGLEAHLNELLYRAQTKSKRYQDAKGSFEALRRKQALAIEEGTTFNRSRELHVAESAYELATKEMDETTHSLQSAYRLIQQCLELAKAPQPQGTGFALVVKNELPTDAALALKETHQFEQLQRICESATLFKGLCIDAKTPNLERMRYLDKMLAKANLPAMFCLIDNEEVALRVANEMGRFLYARLKKSQVADLADGKTTLKALALDTELPVQLQQTTIKFFKKQAVKALGQARQDQKEIQ